MIKITRPIGKIGVYLVDRIQGAFSGNTSDGKQLIHIETMTGTESHDYTYYIPDSVDALFALKFIMGLVSEGELEEITIDSEGYMALHRRASMHKFGEWLFNWWEDPIKKNLHISQKRD